MADLIPDREGFVSEDGHMIHYEYFGRGDREAICLLNGLAMHTKAWYGFLPRLLPHLDVSVDAIEDARAKPWFKDTLFVIVADHCAAADRDSRQQRGVGADGLQPRNDRIGVQDRLLHRPRQQQPRRQRACHRPRVRRCAARRRAPMRRGP